LIISAGTYKTLYQGGKGTWQTEQFLILLGLPDVTWHIIKLCFARSEILIAVLLDIKVFRFMTPRK
jgi:hypothetical protein